MSDDVKAAIAAALTGARLRLWDGCVLPSEADRFAEVAFDAAVEAGMAPAAEVERLREEKRILVDGCQVRDLAIERLRDLSRTHLADDVTDDFLVEAERDRYRQALLDLADHSGLRPDAALATAMARRARAALDGEDE